MKKQIANIVTSSRICIAIALLFFSKINVWFLILFTLAGFTDLIDGPIARATESSSALGSMLDTIADLFLTGATFKAFLTSRYFKKIQLYLIPALIFISFSIPIIAIIKFQEVFFPHCLFSKVLGLTTFLLPYSTLINDQTIAVYIVLGVFVVYIVEALAIQIRSKEPSPDCLTIFQVNKERVQAEYEGIQEIH